MTRSSWLAVMKMWSGRIAVPAIPFQNSVAAREYIRKITTDVPETDISCSELIRQSRGSGQRDLPDSDRAASVCRFNLIPTHKTGMPANLLHEVCQEPL
jgi:hypothetical protein